jgi:hypothetical protein
MYIQLVMDVEYIQSVADFDGVSRAVIIYKRVLVLGVRPDQDRVRRPRL